MDGPIPWRRIEIESPWSPQELEARVARVTQRRWWWFVWPKPPIQFIGPVSGGTFRVIGVARGRNTYAAWVVGRIHEKEVGSRLSAVLTLHPVAIVAVSAFFAGPAVLSWFEGDAGTAVCWALVVVAFHTVMYYVGFRPEARRAEDALRRLAA